MSTATDRRSVAPRTAAAATLALAAACWVVVWHQAQSMGGMRMEMGAGTAVVMMAAMMLPSAVPFVSGFAESRSRSWSWPAATLLLAATYLGVWAAFGVALSLLPIPTTAAGVSAIGAGLYGLFPFRRACQERCRAMSQERVASSKTIPAALGGGLTYGLNCVVTSAGVMVALAAVGMANLAWAAVATGVILLYKLAPARLHLDYAIAAVLIAGGAALVLIP